MFRQRAQQHLSAIVFDDMRHAGFYRVIACAGIHQPEFSHGLQVSHHK